MRMTAQMDYKLEVVPVPVTDIDRAKQFYGERAGFAVDLDVTLPGGNRLVQLTPPGSGCSIHPPEQRDRDAAGGAGRADAHRR
jgi:hypothetical protein